MAASVPNDLEKQKIQNKDNVGSLWVILQTM